MSLGRLSVSDEQAHILYHNGTEPPFSSTLLNEKRDGVYRCAGCGEPLYLSSAKFDSGTGWPSFREALPSAFVFTKDNSQGMQRTEMRCAQCHGHHGHVFNDGPEGTRRFCSNGSVLIFDPK